MGVTGFGTLRSGVNARKTSGCSRRRSLLLIGTSVAVWAALPSAALAQNECGAPPPGGGTVTCPPAGNPYANGITYNGVVEDLTVVLEPDVVVSETVQASAGTAGVDLRIEGETDTSISSSQSGFGVGEGVSRQTLATR